MPKKYRVVDHIAEHLAEIGVDHIFGVDGANIEDLYDAAHFRSDITAVLAKHEFSAATMADGYRRSGSRLGDWTGRRGGDFRWGWTHYTTDAHANFTYLPSRGRLWGEVFADTGLHVRCYPDGGARISVGSRASSLAALSVVSKAGLGLGRRKVG